MSLATPSCVQKLQAASHVNIVCLFREPDAGNLPVRLRVQEKLVCSVGDRPTKVIVRGLVAWIAERREIEFLMPIDKAIFRMVSKSSGRNESERRFGLEKAKFQRKPSSQPEGEGSMGRRKLTDAPDHSGGVEATARWQGYTKQLERPSSSRSRNGRKQEAV